MKTTLVAVLRLKNPKQAMAWSAKTRVFLRWLLLFGLSLVAAVAFFDARPAEAQYIGVGPLGIYLGGHGHHRRGHRRSYRHYHRHARYHGRHHGSYRYGHRLDGGGHDAQACCLESRAEMFLGIDLATLPTF
jgi:hypothetical protein